MDAQLQRIGVLDSTESISMFDEDYQKFRTCMDFFLLYILPSIMSQKLSIILNSVALVWAEHGDEISLEYAGTYALKGDLVR